jgi:hypothetical protein
MSGAAGSSLSNTAKYLRRTTKGASGNGREKRSSTCVAQRSGAADNGLSTTIKYLVNRNVGAGNNWAKSHCTKAGHKFKLKADTGARVCGGPELARCADTTCSHTKLKSFA